MKRRRAFYAKILVVALVLQLIGVFVQPIGVVKAKSYDLDARLVDGMPGVYTVTARPGANGETIGMPSLTTGSPTKEMPAIIMGAAVNNEIKTGPVEYKEFGSGRKAPYSYFHYGIMDEQFKEADGSITTHKKLSGFDGSYYIVRVDVSNIISDHKGKGEYLHVKQEDNKALMVAAGMNDAKTAFTYVSAAQQNSGSCIQTVSLNIDDYENSYAESHKSAARKTGVTVDSGNTYFDVVVLSSGKLAAGADAGKADAPKADIKLSFYVDGVKEYNNLEALDPNNMPTFPYAAPDGKTYQAEADYTEALSKKFYNEETGNSVTPTSVVQNKTSYLIKGSDLNIDSAIDKSEGAKKIPEGQGIKWIDEGDDFWALDSAIAHQPYNNHTIRLICEVPVLQGLQIESSGGLRSVIIDVNSFDIQIANNTDKKSAGLTIGGNSELRLMDSSNTSGAELAIGNNATMVIKKGGVMIIDESCTNEVEYDAATATDPTQVDTSILNGSITVMDGGELKNYGVVNIEGLEAKPAAASAAEQQAGKQTYSDKKSADLEVQYGGLFNNHGCVSLKGVLYVMGTMNNYGRYNDTIVAKDPDKGSTSYHKGIQITWKDDVTQSGVEPGVLNIGIDRDKNIEKRAEVNNYGDLVVVPGTINLYGTLRNSGSDAHVYLCDVDEAIIPITPSTTDPLTVEKRVTLNPPKKSVFNNNGSFIGVLERAKVALLHNGVLGDLTPLGLYDTGSSSTSTSSASSPAAYISSYSSGGGGGGGSSSASVITSGKGAAKAQYTKTGKSTVSYASPSVKKSATSISIPNRIKVGKKTYRVTSVSSYAFTGYDKVKTIKIGANVSKIEPYAFFGCKKLTTVKIGNTKLTAKKIKNCFAGSGVRKVIILKSALKKFKAYKKIFTRKNTGASRKLIIQKEK